MTRERYDEIGRTYSQGRKPDSRLASRAIELAELKGPSVIVDVGAGSGNYARLFAECGHQVIAIEPSTTMLAQVVPHPSVEYVRATATDIPLQDGVANAVISVLSLHHIEDHASAILEWHRVAADGRIVIFTFDRRLSEDFWLVDYFPDVWNKPFRDYPPVTDLASLIQRVTSRPVDVFRWNIPHDIEDFILPAGWRRPELYLNDSLRDCNSSFALSSKSAISTGVKRLGEDIDTGRWYSTYGEIQKQDEFDAGYRFIVA